ncbi:MAG: cupin domain-containing protein [Reyranellales bacterium]
MPADPLTFLFDDDGETPNNPSLPLVLYRGAVALDGAADPAAVFEKVFARHGWGDGWRNGIFDFLHFHTSAHEVLGVARGRARVEFGGAAGREVDLEAGDVAVLPAGVGHRRVSGSRDLLVVGAYPEGGGNTEARRPQQVSHGAAIAAIARTPLPAQDPVFGGEGPLTKLWKV